MRSQKTYCRPLLAMAVLLTLVGFVPTGLCLFAALGEAANQVVLKAALPTKPTPNQ